MSVQAITPRVVAISGHLQFHGASCAGDCCNWDRFTDELATGPDIFDPSWPDVPLRLGRRTRSSQPFSVGLLNPSARPAGVLLPPAGAADPLDDLSRSGCASRSGS